MLTENDKQALKNMVEQYGIYGGDVDKIIGLVKKIDNTKDLDFFEEEFIKKFNPHDPILSTQAFKRILTDQLNQLITTSGLSSSEDLIYLVARVCAFTDDHKSLVIEHDKVIRSAVEKMKKLQFQAQQAEKMIASLSKNAKDVAKAKRDWTEIFSVLSNSNKFDNFIRNATGFMSQIKSLAKDGAKKLSSNKDSIIESINKQLGQLNSSFRNLLDDIPNPQITQQLSRVFNEFAREAEELLRQLREPEIDIRTIIELQNKLNSMWNSLQPTISRLSPSFNLTKLKDAVSNMKLPNISKFVGKQDHISVDFMRLTDREEEYSVQNGVILKGLTKKYELKNSEKRLEFAEDLIKAYQDIVSKIKDIRDNNSLPDFQTLERAKYLLEKAKEFNTWVKDHADSVGHDAIELSRTLYNNIKDMHVELDPSIYKPKGFKKLAEKYARLFEDMRENIATKKGKIKRSLKRKFRKSLLTKYKSSFRVKRFDKFMKSKEMSAIFVKYNLNYKKLYQGKTSGLGSIEKLGEIRDTTGHAIVTVRGGNFNFSALQNRLGAHQKDLFELLLKRMASKKNPPPIRVTGCILDALCEILAKYIQKHGGMKTIAVDVQVADSELRNLSSEQRKVLAAHQHMIGKDVSMFLPQDNRPSIQDQKRNLQEAQEFRKPFVVHDPMARDKKRVADDDIPGRSSKRRK